MPRTFFHDITLEVLLCGNSFELVATIEFTATPVVPATWDDPAEGGEVEVIGVEGLAHEWAYEVVDEPGGVPKRVKKKTFMDCPPALAELILANVDEDDLYRSADFDDGPDPDSWYDRMKDERY